MLRAIAILIVAVVTAGLAAGCGGAKPAISAIVPQGGAGGSLAAIAGTGFGTSQGSGKVLFGNAEATVQSWTDVGIAIQVPADLKEGTYRVKVTIGSAESNSVEFKVTASSSGQSPSDGKKSGEIENTTPVDAMLAYLKSKGEPTTGLTFQVYAVSSSDPNWKIDSSKSPTNPQTQFYLLHKVNGKWQVLAYGTDFNPQQYGAPADLSLTAPQPARPSDQAKAIEAYLQSKGRPTDAWQLSVLKESATDPNWEIIAGERQGVQDNFLLIWNNMLGDWEVLADGGPPWAGVEFKGQPVPDDLNSI